MPNENENLDSSNEGSEEIGENDDLTAAKEKFEKLNTSNKQLFERAKKAEAEAKELKQFKAEAEAKAKAEADKARAEANKPELNKPNEPDYGRLAYLHARGLTEQEDIKVVQDEAERLRLPLTDVLAMSHIQSKLQANKEEREAKAGLPMGSRRAGGYAQKDVDYYLQNPDKIPPTQELSEKVLEAKQKSEKGNMFSDIEYTG